MESRWRGANGEFGGEAGDEYALFCSFSRELRRYRGRTEDIMESCPIASQSLLAVIERQMEAGSSQTLQQVLQSEEVRKKNIHLHYQVSIVLYYY